MVVGREVPIGSLIRRVQGVNGERPCLAGMGFSIHQLSVLYNEGADAGEILRRYPQLDLPGIHAGLAYYLANRSRIDDEVARDSSGYWAEVAIDRTLNPAHAADRLLYLAEYLLE